MSKKKIASICIPSYNRPVELQRLLNSIDIQEPSKIEIIIREDHAPKRKEVRKVVDEFKKSTLYDTYYIENETNFGYDKNLRSVAGNAHGEWVIFMGDDDVFIEGSLDKYINFFEKNKHIAYVLRRYRRQYRNGKEEDCRYSKGNVFFRKGEDAIIELFRRSVFISGVTYRRSRFQDYACDKLDGTLLFQLYIQASICNKYASAYCDIPITKSIEGGVPGFGNSKAERGLYQSGENTFSNSINFLKQVRVVTEYFDHNYNTSITGRVLKDYAKYSFGYLYEHRDDGRKVFKKYAKEIKRIGLGNSVYFYIYYVGLYFLGKRRCLSIIIFIKKMIGKTPRL